jgi:hypothetical protein
VPLQTIMAKPATATSAPPCATSAPAPKPSPKSPNYSTSAATITDTDKITLAPRFAPLSLVADTATVVDLRTLLQTVFGWGGEHLHRFVIHGSEYGISYPGGSGFRDDARRVWLAELGLRAGERFTYDNVTAGWRLDLRVSTSCLSAAGEDDDVWRGWRHWW